jgi:K+-transporting ATPase ATPase A chain
VGNAIIQVGIFSALVTAISVPLGLYMARVFAGERTMLDPVLRPIERVIYRLCGIHPEAEETWVEYAVSMLLFSMVGMLVLYAMERLQYFLPIQRSGARPRLQHCRELHHQYELAGVWRRIDHELLHANGGARLS